MCQKGVVRGVGAEVGRSVDAELDSNVGGKVGELVQLKVGDYILSINMSKMKSM